MIFPISANAITIKEIEKKLLEAQSQEDIEIVILEVVTSSEYQEACQLLFQKIASMSPPKTQADAEKALPTLQDYENLKCPYTKRIWGDPPEQLSKTQCNELIVKFEEYNEKYWNIAKELQRITDVDGIEASLDFKETSEWWYLKDLKRETNAEYRKLCLPTPQECDEMKQESMILNEKWIELDEKYNNEVLEQKLVSIDLQEIKDRIGLRCDYINSLMQYYEAQEKYLNIPISTLEPLLHGDPEPSSSENICGIGTIEKDGICIPDPNYQKSSKGGGCLIATATYGSELAPQVQQLRELRDNQLLQTEVGTSFINLFNDFYYSFSPIIADYERENPVFREMVKIAITPMITSLSILNYVDIDSEVEVLGYGISLIMLNGMMYVGIPILAIMRFRK